MSCWAEFDIPIEACEKINKVVKELSGQTMDSGDLHVSLLYGYNENESAKLIELCTKYRDLDLGRFFPVL